MHKNTEDKIGAILAKSFTYADANIKRTTIKNPISRDSSSSSVSDADNQITGAVIDAIESNNKIVEIRPAKRPSVLGRVAPLLLVGSAVGTLLWWRKSGKPSKTIQSVANKTAERTKEVTEQAAEAVEEGGETVSEEVARESRKASDEVEQMGEDVAESAEEAGDEVSKRADGSGD